MIIKSWGELGVDLKQNTVEFNTMTETIDPASASHTDDWNVFFMAASYTGLSNASLNSAEGYTGTDENPIPGGNNYAQIYNKELNDLLNAGKQTGDPAVSEENYKKAMILSSELCPYLAIYGNNQFNIYNKRVKDVKTGPVCNWSQALEGASLDLNAQIAASDADESAAPSEASSTEE